MVMLQLSIEDITVHADLYGENNTFTNLQVSLRCIYRLNCLEQLWRKYVLVQFS